MNIENMQVKLFKALAHPVRLNIIKKLIPGELCVCELTNDTEFSKSNLSQHLKILKDAGILISEKDGLRVNYSIYNEKIRNIVEISEELIKENIEKIR